MSVRKQVSLLLYQLYWDQIALPINYTVYFFKFIILQVHKRSTKNHITSKTKRFDTLGEMQKLEIGRNNMANYLNSIPDECIIDLANKVYCQNVR